jgi:copper transport protein
VVVPVVAGGGPPDEPVGGAEAAGAAAQVRAVADDLPAFRRSVLVEFAVAVVVLVLSAVLVGATPGRSVAAPQPLAATLPLQGSAGTRGSVQVAVDPARPGPNVLHLYLFDAGGRLIQPTQISATLAEPAAQIGPIDVKLRPGGPGHYLADDMTIPTAGTWTLTVTARLDEFTAVTAGTPFPVR